MRTRTLFIIKPDAVERRLVRDIVDRIKSAGFRIVRSDLRIAGRELVEQHYQEHKGKDFFDALVDSMAGHPVVAGIVEAENAVTRLRELIGPYEPRIPGTIRGDYAIDRRRNSIHASADAEAVTREIALWYPNTSLWISRQPG